MAVLIIGIVITAIVVLNPTAKKGVLLNPLITQQKSPAFLEYSDPSGFSFSYPDNLSIIKNDIADDNTYADLLLSSKDISGSLSLKITDSKFTSLDDWLKVNRIIQAPKEVKLGSLKALEVQLADRLILGALDQGIFFNIEMPAVEKDFWMPVYNKILEGFTFAPPTDTPSSGSVGSSDDISFEGEEVVE